MGGFRIRWPFTIIWTAVCLWAIAMLAQGGSQPVSADCLEWCGLEGQIAAILIPAVVVVWLVGHGGGRLAVDMGHQDPLPALPLHRRAAGPLLPELRLRPARGHLALQVATARGQSALAS